MGLPARRQGDGRGGPPELWTAGGLPALLDLSSEALASGFWLWVPGVPGGVCPPPVQLEDKGPLLSAPSLPRESHLTQRFTVAVTATLLPHNSRSRPH